MAFAQDMGINQYKSRFYDDITPGAVDYGINPALRPTANYAPPAATGPGGSPQMMHELGHSSLVDSQIAAPDPPMGTSEGDYAGTASGKVAPEKTEVAKLDDYIARQAAKLENPNISEEELAGVTRKSRAAAAKERVKVSKAGSAVGSTLTPKARPIGRGRPQQPASYSNYSNQASYSRPASTPRPSVKPEPFVGPIQKPVSSPKPAAPAAVVPTPEAPKPFLRPINDRPETQKFIAPSTPSVPNGPTHYIPRYQSQGGPENPEGTGFTMADFEGHEGLAAGPGAGFDHLPGADSNQVYGSPDGEFTDVRGGAAVGDRGIDTPRAIRARNGEVYYITPRDLQTLMERDRREFEALFGHDNAGVMHLGVIPGDRKAAVETAKHLGRQAIYQIPGGHWMFSGALNPADEVGAAASDETNSSMDLATGILGVGAGIKGLAAAEKAGAAGISGKAGYAVGSAERKSAEAAMAAAAKKEAAAAAAKRAKGNFARAQEAGKAGTKVKPPVKPPRATPKSTTSSVAKPKPKPKPPSPSFGKGTKK